jgi:hypothetical protein
MLKGVDQAGQETVNSLNENIRKSFFLSSSAELFLFECELSKVHSVIVKAFYQNMIMTIILDSNFRK